MKSECAHADLSLRCSQILFLSRLEFAVIQNASCTEITEEKIVCIKYIQFCITDMLSYICIIAEDKLIKVLKSLVAIGA